MLRTFRTRLALAAAAVTVATAGRLRPPRDGVAGAPLRSGPPALRRAGRRGPALRRDRGPGAVLFGTTVFGGALAGAARSPDPERLGVRAPRPAQLRRHGRAEAVGVRCARCPRRPVPRHDDRRSTRRRDRLRATPGIVREIQRTGALRLHRRRGRSGAGGHAGPRRSRRRLRGHAVRRCRRPGCHRRVSPSGTGSTELAPPASPTRWAAAVGPVPDGRRRAVRHALRVQLGRPVRGRWPRPDAERPRLHGCVRLPGPRRRGQPHRLLVEDARTGVLYGTTQYGGVQDDGRCSR